MVKTIKEQIMINIEVKSMKSKAKERTQHFGYSESIDSSPAHYLIYTLPFFPKTYMWGVSTWERICLSLVYFVNPHEGSPMTLIRSSALIQSSLNSDQVTNAETLKMVGEEMDSWAGSLQFNYLESLYRILPNCVWLWSPKNLCDPKTAQCLGIRKLYFSLFIEWIYGLLY